jgi:hypothetical protein
MLTLTAAVKLFQAVARRDPQILKRLRVVQHCELATGGVLDALKARRALAVKERFRVLTSEGSFSLGAA